MAVKETSPTKLIPKIIPKIISKGPKAIAEPEKELRFTRSVQAYVFFIISVISFATAMAFFILSTQDWGMDGPLLPGWWWVCIPTLLITLISIRLGIRCVRHAYIILSPLGLEIFPFLKAEKNLQLIYWGEIHDAEVHEKKLTIHFTEEKTSGIVASLSPIPKTGRVLLQKAIRGVLENRKEK
ncbi:MAG: hypothetical protein ACSHX0_11705 [Akkermansiaceae bacterium]